jgi:hypothetical protein
VVFVGGMVDVLHEDSALADHGVRVTASVILLVEGQPLVTFPTDRGTTRTLLPGTRPVRRGDSVRVVYLPEDSGTVCDRRGNGCRPG